MEKEGAVDELETNEAVRFLKKLELHLYYMVKKVRFYSQTRSRVPVANKLMNSLMEK